MSDAYKNFASVVDLLEAHDVHVTAVDHTYDYTDGTPRTEFEITVSVPVFGPAEWRDVPDTAGERSE